MSRRSTADQPLTSSAARLHTRAGESNAPPQLSPHLSDETVDLVLSEEDRATVLGEVQRLEACSLVVQVQFEIKSIETSAYFVRGFLGGSG